MFCSHREHIAHLEAEIAWLRDRMDTERKRAEMAIDEERRVRRSDAVPLVQDIPVAPSEREAERLIREIAARDTEFTTATI